MGLSSGQEQEVYFPQITCSYTTIVCLRHEIKLDKPFKKVLGTETGETDRMFANILESEIK